MSARERYGLQETYEFLRKHRAAFPVSESDSALLAIALHALRAVADGNPGLVPNLVRGIEAFLGGAVPVHVYPPERRSR